MTSGRCLAAIRVIDLWSLCYAKKMPSDTGRSRASPLAVRAAGQVRSRDIRVALNMSFILRCQPGIFAV